MSYVDELQELVAKTGTKASAARAELYGSPEHLPSDVTDEFLHGILKALGIIGKILAEKK